MAVCLTGFAFDALPPAFAQSLGPTDPAQDFQIPFVAKQEPTFYFKRETFKPYLNGVFKLSAGRNSVSGTLVSVSDCTPSPRNKLTPKSRPTDCFSLVFRANGALTDLTSVYDVEHAALGKFALFLTCREGQQGQRGFYFYEAVFNHVL